MPEMIYNDLAVAKASGSARWAALTRLDLDVATIGTWDTALPRHLRVLVPIDVQAIVVPDVPTEGTVGVAGMRGDPEPFAPVAPRASGVHLHWAMPDALMRGEHVDGATSVTLPELPDRWVVIRTLLPVGGRLVHVKGWVVDAAKGSVTPLHEYSGTTLDAGTPTFDPLDGSSGGTLLWSATYQGALNRFALHDDLADLPELKRIAPLGFHAERASYTVAGWWTDAAGDPLATSTGDADRHGALARVAHLRRQPRRRRPFDRPRIARLAATSGLDSPDSNPPVYQVSKYATSTTRYSDVSPAAAVPVAEHAAHFIGVAPTRYHSLLHGSVLGVPISGAVSASSADDRPSPATLATAIGLDLDDVTAALAAPGFGVTDAQRTSAERLMAAFTSDLLNRIGTPDGVNDIEEHEHADAFWTFIGAPLPEARDDRLRAEDSIPLGPTAVGRKGRGALAGTRAVDTVRDGVLESKLLWKQQYLTVMSGSSASASKPATAAGPRAPTRSTAADAGGSRSVAKPAPRMFRPAPPIVAVRGIRPNPRHHGDGMFDPEGLRCRWPGECRPGFRRRRRPGRARCRRSATARSRPRC